MSNESPLRLHHKFSYPFLSATRHFKMTWMPENLHLELETNLLGLVVWISLEFGCRSAVLLGTAGCFRFTDPPAVL